MRWRRTTSPGLGALELVTQCPTEGCRCNLGSASPGELCEVVNGAVAVALEGVAPGGKRRGLRVDGLDFAWVFSLVFIGFHWFLRHFVAFLGFDL